MPEDLSLNIKTYNGMENGISGLKAKELQVLNKLREIADQRRERGCGGRGQRMERWPKRQGWTSGR